MKNGRAFGVVRGDVPRGSSAWVLALCFAAACGGNDGAPGASGAAGTNGANGGEGVNGKGGADFDAGVAPANAPQSISFFDDDPIAGRVEGVATIGKAADESDVSSYAVYYGTSATEKLYLTPIVELPKTGADVTFQLSTDPIPTGATYLLAYARNAAGESAVGVATALHDGQVAWTDVSAGLGLQTIHPSLAIDEAAGKLGYVANTTSFIRCDLDDASGASCEAIPVTNDSFMEPSLMIDAPDGKILVASSAQDTRGPEVTRCDLSDTTGASCIHTDVSSGRAAGSGNNARLAIDRANGKLLVVTQDESNGTTKPSLFRCDLTDTTGTTCVWVDISAGRPSGSGVFPQIAIDAARGKLLVVTRDESNDTKPSLFRCDLSDATGASCTWTDISAGRGTGSGAFPALLVDQTNDKLLVVSEDDADGTRPALFRCDLADTTGSSCTWTDLSAGRGDQSGTAVSAALDSANSKFIVVSDDNANNGKPSLFRCEVDGSACTWTDLSAGRLAQSGTTPSLAVAPSTGRFFALTTDESNHNGAALFTLR